MRSSSSVRVASAWTSAHTGDAIQACSLECRSIAGPPQSPPSATSSRLHSPLQPRISSGWPSRPAVRSRSKAASARRSAARARTTAGRLGLPSSSSPSTISTTVSGGIASSSRSTSTARKKAARQPLELALPLATTAGPTPASSRTSAANGGEVHSGSSAGWTSYMP